MTETSDEGEVLLAAGLEAGAHPPGQRGRARAEGAELSRLNRMLRALGKSSQAMLRATDEATFLEQVCRIFVEDCGHLMVWIGFVEDDPGKTIRPVACAGSETGYLDTLHLTWADSERGRGPTGTAIRTGRPSACTNMLADPRFAPWRDEAIKRGYASCAGIPLLADGKAFGAITIYSREPGPFSEDEQKLLAELANDLVYGITTLRLRADQERAEEALRRSEEKLRLAQDAARMGIWDWNITTGELVLSESCMALLGLPPDTAMSYEAFLGAVHDQDRVDEAVRRALETRQPYDMEMRVRMPDGSVRWIASKGQGYYDAAGRPVRMSGLSMDITDRKRAEDELREADRRKADFLGVLSHELRNPLAPIRNSIYLLERAAPGSEQASRARQVIRRQTEHLARLVDDLLDVTRISRGKIDLQRSVIDLRDVVGKTTDDLRSLFEQSGVELRVEHSVGPVWVEADPTRLAQVLGNLLQNAVKFTPSGGLVVVGVARRGAQAEMSVRDSGLGIDPQQLERIFEPFAQVDRGLARTKGGLGLGLSLVRGLVELHGGAVRARSEGAGRGAEIVVELPIAAARPADPVVPDSPAGTSGHLVLIIEDNVDAGQTLADVLEMNGHRVRLARDGRSGIALARELRPDVVVCDIGLPDLDGYEVARALRSHEALRSTRLIALSGYAQPEDRQRAREAGFDAHLAKPTALDELTRVIASDR